LKRPSALRSASRRTWSLPVFVSAAHFPSRNAGKSSRGFADLHYGKIFARRAENIRPILNA
jgi:hypothetical protein